MRRHKEWMTDSQEQIQRPCCLREEKFGSKVFFPQKDGVISVTAEGV